MSSLPSGTVTFLFTDIEGSTKLAQEHPDKMPSLLARHNEMLNQAINNHNGFVFQIVGDSFSAAFHSVSDALDATLDAQRALHEEAWSPAPIKVRMGIHTGIAELRDISSEIEYEGYTTIALTQRVMSAGHGGQILVSQTVYELLSSDLSEKVQLVDMGEHHLKDVLQRQHLYQVSAPNLPTEFPPLKTQKIINHNLPTQLTSFIGRERELIKVKKKLTEARLLTLIGPGGTGKTRLSIQIAGEQISDFKDGAWIVELAPISDTANIATAIASVFDLREVQNIPLVNILLDYLRAKELLLILDNCEHLVEASAQITDQLLHSCPRLKIIASSREALGIDGETIYRVPSLKDDESTRLFVERATKAEPRFRLTDENAAFIAQICSRLDGIPLAIELAAARVKLFTPAQIAERLDDRFKLLTGGSRTALERQQTLRALIDWSYITLNEVEQRALRQLAVFSGGWTFEAAESVIGESEAMDGLMGLVNKSLVNVKEQDGESRYRFLETIRQYAMEKLSEAGEAVQTRDEHLDYMLGIAQQAGDQMFGAESQEWFDQMELEHDNLRAAFEWGTSNHPEKALKLAYAVGGFWTVRDHISEARARCRVILDKTKSMPGVDAERARVYSLLAWMSVTSGEHKSGRAAAERAISLGSQTNDLVTVARAHGILALTSVFLGDFPTAQRAAMVGESLARRQGFNSELAFVLSVRAQMEYVSKNDLEQAKAFANEAFQLARDEGFLWASSFMIIGMAHTAAMLGDLETAREKFTESGEMAAKLGNKRVAYMSQSELAHVLRNNGELDEPLGIYKDLLPRWKDLGHRAAVAHELECIAYILTRKEEPERAAILLGAAQEIRRVIDTPRTNNEEGEYEKELVMLREMLGEENAERKWNEGCGLTIDQAMELALE
jgi:predicted ATPase/class 3 adenylate cyclase